MNKLTLIALSVATISFGAHAAKTVTPENYARAEVDMSLESVVKDVGSNAFRHDRSLIPLD